MYAVISACNTLNAVYSGIYIDCSLANREPVQVNQDWPDMTKARILSNNSRKGVLNKLKAK